MILKSIKNLFKKKPKVKEVVKKEIKKEEPLVLTEEVKEIQTENKKKLFKKLNLL